MPQPPGSRCRPHTDGVAAEPRTHPATNRSPSAFARLRRPVRSSALTVAPASTSTPITRPSGASITASTSTPLPSGSACSFPPAGHRSPAPLACRRALRRQAPVHAGKEINHGPSTPQSRDPWTLSRPIRGHLAGHCAPNGQRHHQDRIYVTWAAVVPVLPIPQRPGHAVASSPACPHGLRRSSRSRWGQLRISESLGDPRPHPTASGQVSATADTESECGNYGI